MPDGRGLDALPLREDLRGRSAYGAPQLDVPVRLNTNENPYPPPPGLVDALADAVRGAGATLNRYPDRDAVALRTDLAAYLSRDVGGLTAANVWAANGSNEVLQQLFQAFGGHGRSALGFEPTYSMYSLIALGTATRWIEAGRGEGFDLDADAAVAAVRAHRPDLVLLCSPNNPTGTALPLDVVRAVLDAAPGMVVVDEAYAEFAREGVPSALTRLAGRPRLVVIRTMSKAFGSAGTRLGYLAADPAVVDALQLVRLPYHLSALTQAAARTALAFADQLLANVDALRRERDRLVRDLRDGGFTVVPSDANFVMFGRFRSSSEAWERLLAEGVLVRDNGLPGWLRVTAGLPAENDAFLAAVGKLTELREGS